ncbi:glutathione S-transferase family protein [Anaeromyxobacter diazotrophicus]|uniref:Glutathione S-transferase n=1 Tax=Anaeromyxobacter diazotrophicus TaxID=2590199 RepID=A0A7I9VGJ0_9BACT|nr:glutathione S-transferase family protein [Anaeromyxobacter diazotrophicus]GEJ55514.1 glutathione S-transferase [Anaeromyxobacter diazotrophicus]
MLELVIGNKNYSSWSMRAWLALELTGAPYREILVALDRPDTAERIRAHSPAGRVPVLRDGELTVWDSLAICEYLAEKFPSAELWPAAPARRAVARAAAAEMHAGFQALRAGMPMNLGLHRPTPPSAEVAADLARIRALWRELLAAPRQGEYLFGRFGIADAFFAPVVGRCRTYGVALDGPEAGYAEEVWRHPAVAKWVAGASQESQAIPKYDLK